MQDPPLRGMGVWLTLVELDPDLALAIGHGEGEILAVTNPVAIQYPNDVVAGDRIARK